MKYFITSLLLTFTITSATIVGMHNNTTELNMCITNPTHIVFLNHKVVIAGDNGVNFYNVNTHTYAHLEEGCTINDLAANNSKTKIGTTSKGVVTVYNAETCTKEWDLRTQFDKLSIAFDSQNEEQLIAHGLPNHLFFFQAGKLIKSHNMLNYPSTLLFPIYCHPQHTSIIHQKISNGYNVTYTGLQIFYTNPKQSHNLLSQTTLHNTLSVVPSRICSVVNCDNTNHTDIELVSFGAIESYVYDFTISPNGQHSITLPSNNKSLYINKPCLQQMIQHNNCIGVLFHPYLEYSLNNPIFATLSYNDATRESTLIYYDFESVIKKTIKPLYIQEIPNIDTKELFNTKRLSFSPNGKSLAILLGNKAFIYRVPFEMINQKLYHAGTIKQCAVVCFLLNNFLIDNIQHIPYDIALIIIKNILEASSI